MAIWTDVLTPALAVGGLYLGWQQLRTSAQLSELAERQDDREDRRAQRELHPMLSITREGRWAAGGGDPGVLLKAVATNDGGVTAHRLRMEVAIAGEVAWQGVGTLLLRPGESRTERVLVPSRCFVEWRGDAPAFTGPVSFRLVRVADGELLAESGVVA
jgi:hypothetical protein